MAERRGRGEGSVEELPSGKWRAVLSLGVVKGKRRKKTFTADTKREALSWMRARQAELKQGSLADAGKLTFGQWLESWRTARKNAVSAVTQQTEEPRVRRYIVPALGEIRLDRFRAEDLEALLGGMVDQGNSASERHEVCRIVRACLKAAVKRGLLPRNPAEDVRMPRVERPEKVALNLEEAGRLLAAAANYRQAAWFDLALDAGMRPAELFALHWPDVDLVAGSVFVRYAFEYIRKQPARLKSPKTARGKRRILIGKRTVEALAGHKERMRAERQDTSQGFVFVTEAGKPIDHLKTFREYTFWRCVKRAGVPRIRMYDMRHTSATLLLLAGINVKVVSERLGHASIETTLKHYAHCLPAMQEAAAAAIDSLFGKPVPFLGSARGRPRKQK